MSGIEIFSFVLGILGTVCAMVFGYIAFHRNRKKEDETSGEKSGVLLTEIGYIKSGVDDIKRKQEKQDAQYIETVARLTAVEASTKQAHKRIDTIEGRNYPS